MCAAITTSPSVNTDTLIIDKGKTNKFQYHFSDIHYYSETENYWCQYGVGL